MSTSELRYFSSESVTEGHPDKICDQISDAVLDDLLGKDPDAKVAVETMVTTGLVHVAGEVNTDAYADVAGIVRSLITGIGYDSSDTGFDGHSCGVSVSIGSQSTDIHSGVTNPLDFREALETDHGSSLGAGDQGLMFGYADNATDVLMPLPIHLASRMAERLSEVRKSGELDYLRPDGKTQLTLGYDGDTAVSLENIVVSTQHAAGIDQEQLKADIRALVIDPIADASGLDRSGENVHINPAGPFVTGGPMGDAGLTGRKIIVDTYGGFSRHGGGAFSGKDPSKVDRSAAYAMRWVAKNIVAAGLADRAEVQVSYAIGRVDPMGLYVETFGTEKVDPAAITRAIREVFDLRPAMIIQELDLLRPIYSQTSTYGHFGRELPDFTWERTDRADDLLRAVSAN
ncbi:MULTISPECIES: methionine adenosyltransferase [Brevibacterium]|uniref:S-adenosylmethionine synthase n=5 Tax=Bacteria TaxID=2 RepID=K9B2I1_9MICO|nr:methionine adenosyltransferase [Brevibacterium casei]NJE68295.1 methionine adenosyltransferase [Brevibacterium sp. LS14]EKU47940.1 S-adenosylmethionine synthetase [Brevibacterium casei S18]KZE18177.1 S-adenosylmethionine synthetase [Brevibacterium casei]MBE4693944.1 methionine adenosyltransferase [Brevibacterium casei]MBY3577067.1 methionine adenosyltransferase [Brevibacterium casei]